MADIQSSQEEAGTQKDPLAANQLNQAVSQDSLLQALLHLRSELARVQNERNEMASEHTALLEQLEAAKRAAADTNQEQTEALHTRLELLENEKTELVKERDALATELRKTGDAKKYLETQHQNVIAKLASVKNFTDKVKAEMDELNQAREKIAKSTQKNQELTHAVAQLQSDLSTARSERTEAQQELDLVRAQAIRIQERTAQELADKDNVIRGLHGSLEQSERQREEWETVAMEERSEKDAQIALVKQLEREIEILKNDKEVLRAEKEAEFESLTNLQLVLGEFQEAKESEIREAVEDTQRRLTITSNELAEYKERATLAEEQLSKIKEEITRAQRYEKELKEKNLLIGKLRHEAVILNEHLTEALRRMREESSENNVDKRLITNLVISFLSAPRGDTKRFEILQLIANMLQWTDDQKERVGLIRKAPQSARTPDERNSGAWLSPITDRPRARLSEDIPRSRRSSEEERTRELPGQSFSDMWIQFLLKEANKENAGQGDAGGGRPSNEKPAAS